MRKATRKYKRGGTAAEYKKVKNATLKHESALPNNVRHYKALMNATQMYETGKTPASDPAANRANKAKNTQNFKNLLKATRTHESSKNKLNVKGVKNNHLMGWKH